MTRLGSQRAWRRAAAAARAFGGGDDGAMTVLALVFGTMLLAFGALVVDFGRLYNLHSQMQAYVDHVALAAAAELDGEADAIDRARRAALGPAPGPLVVDTQNFALGTAELEIQEPVFLSALPPDSDPDLSPYVTTDSREARFVWVGARPRTQSFWLLPLVRLLGVTAAMAEATVAPEAVAGFTRELCNFPPMMMCNPYETATNKSFTPIIGQQILLKGQGAGTAWAPGDFGLLDTVAGGGEGVCTGGLGGTNRIRCVMALIQPNTSCVAGRVNIRPGQAVSIHSGLNVRFDIWDPPLNSKRNDARFSPAANVTKGKRHNPNQCSMSQLEPAPDTVALPRDPCFATGTCPGGRFGDGVTTAQLQDYWSANHGGAALPGSLVGGTRYDVYRYEIDNGLIPLSASGYPAGENGAPTCAPSGYDNPLRDRRTLLVAVINCLEHNVQGSTDNVPVIAFAEMFMTEPVGDAPDHDLYAEMLGVVDPGGEDGVLHDYPQLYR